MGQPKQILPFLGATMIRTVVDSALASKCVDVHVVVGAFADQISEELSELPVKIHRNPDWEQGMGTSIRCGVLAAACDPALDAILLLLADQPFVTANIINQLIDTAESSNAPIIASAYQETVGVPSLFTRSTFHDLSHLPPQSGAKPIIERSSGCIIIPVPEAAFDIDTLDDYRSACQPDQPATN